MDYFKGGQLEFGALPGSVGSTFRTRYYLFENRILDDINLQMEEAVHGPLIRA